jgi:hypothetical protein
MGKAAGAVSGSLGTIAGGLASAKYAKAAGRAGMGGAKEGEETIRNYGDLAQSYLADYQKSGSLALSPLTGLLTGQQYDPASGQTTALSPEQRDALMYQSPGYKFAVEQGQQGLAKSQAARGLSLSGGAQKELAGFLSGSASQYSNDYISQLGALASMGKEASTTAAGIKMNEGQGIAGYQYARGLNKAQMQSNLGGIYGGMYNQLGAIGQDYFNSTDEDSMKMFQSVMGSGGGGGGGAGGAAGMSGMLGGLSGGSGGIGAAAAASDMALKENIEKVGEENGFNIYEFNYIGKPGRYKGVMAQEVARLRPDAVTVSNGFLAVYYDKIGIQFEKLN